MKKILLTFSLFSTILMVSACGGSTENYDGQFTINGVKYHCTSSEAGNLCNQGNCSKCDKV